MPRGYKVVARNKEDGFYYPGVVVKSISNQYAKVEFVNNQIKVVSTKWIIPRSGAIAVPFLMSGDFVLIRVINPETQMEQYKPGYIEFSPYECHCETKVFYTIRIYDGKRETALRNSLIKIRKWRYLKLVRYILLVQNQDRERIEGSTKTPRISSDQSIHRTEENVYVPTPENSSDENEDPRQLSINQLDIESTDSPVSISDILSPCSQSSSVASQILQSQRSQHEKYLIQRRIYRRKIGHLKRTLRRLNREGQVDVSNVDSGELEYHTTDVQNVTSSFLEKRKSLLPLRKGEEVLARWSDEGWYFRGTVQHSYNDFSYSIEDSTGMCEIIFREDIITDFDDQNQITQPRDRVIALHPEYVFSYAPGTVVQVLDDSTQLRIKVRFYDGLEFELSRDEVYKIWDEKYEHDVSYIVACEIRWVERVVVARNDVTGWYQLATVIDRIGNGHEYKIEWCNASNTVGLANGRGLYDDTSAVITATNMFGPYTPPHPVTVGDHVLAEADSQGHKYLPGWVSGVVGQKIHVNFCNNTLKDIDNEPYCLFWLSSRYYENAVDYYTRCQEIQNLPPTPESV